MLRFIHQQWIFPASRLAISIHLMLRFIEPIRDCPSECLEFQYISCYGLSLPVRVLALARQYFNTSHVTVYLVRYIFLNGSLIFQYISCYGLSRWEPYVSRKMGISIHLMLRFIIPIPGKLIHNRPFQYISCYGLSHLSNKCLSRPYSFQYISCYGLSG